MEAAIKKKRKKPTAKANGAPQPAAIVGAPTTSPRPGKQPTIKNPKSMSQTHKQAGQKKVSKKQVSGAQPMPPAALGEPQRVKKPKKKKKNVQQAVSNEEQKKEMKEAQGTAEGENEGKEEEEEDAVFAAVLKMDEEEGLRRKLKNQRKTRLEQEEQELEGEEEEEEKEVEVKEEEPQEEEIVPTFNVRKKRKKAVLVVEAKQAHETSSLQAQIRKKFTKAASQQPKGLVLPPLKYTAAPMVGKSDLAFRMLCRRYGVQLAYTPMYEASLFAEDSNYQAQFQTHANDRPLAVQFCGNDPEVLLKAARLVETKCDLIDINLGCPQRRAHAGHYGAFLLDEQDHELVFAMVRKLARNLSIPVSCKIRLLPTPEATLKFCLGLEKAGCAMIAVHARYRGSPTQPRSGPAHLDQLPALKRALSIPIVTNGNTKTFEDVTQNLKSTECDGLMAGEGLLDNPALFAPSLNQTTPEGPELAVEYLALCRKYGSPPPEWVRGNVLRMCRKLLLRFQVQLELERATTLEEIGNVVATLKQYRDDPTTFESNPNKLKEIQSVLSARKLDKKQAREEEYRRKKIERRAAERAAREAQAVKLEEQNNSHKQNKQTKQLKTRER